MLGYAVSSNAYYIKMWLNILMKYLKPTLIFIAGMLAGAIILYGYLWYQVLGKFEATWCQVYTGQFSVDQAKECEKYHK